MADEAPATGDTVPWMQAAIEETTALFDEDWSPSGVEPNRRMIQTLLDEEALQGLIATSARL